MLARESSHRDYKSVFAANLRQFLVEGDSTGRFSKCLMPRMLLRSVELFNQRPFLPKRFELQNPSAADEVAQASGIKNARVSSKCLFPLQDCLRATWSRGIPMPEAEASSNSFL